MNEPQPLVGQPQARRPNEQESRALPTPEQIAQDFLAANPGQWYCATGGQVFRK